MKNHSNITTQMLQHRKISTSRMVFEISFDWAQIILLLVFFIWIPAWWSFLLVFILLGSRQYSLLILLHDAQHTLLNDSRKINDIVAIWLLAAPFGVLFSKSRMTHMQHHKHLGAANGDPDYPLYCIKEPAPKDTTAKLITHFLRQIFWGKLVRVFLPDKNAYAKSATSSRLYSATPKWELLVVLICQVIIFAGFTLAGFWHAYFYLWLLPLLIVATFLNDARIFCEHSNPQDIANRNRGLLISYISTPIERFFFSPHHMNYHAEHHFFPFIPHYHLPKVRRALIALPEYQNQIQWRPGYCSHIRRFMKSTTAVSVENLSEKASSETI